MIDLIEKIHELKDYENYDYDQAITDVRILLDQAITDAEILLDQYNIITAPKTIKLSEIVDKICDTNYKSECWVEPIRLGKGNYKIRTQYGDGYWGDYDFYIEDKKIVMYQDDYLLPFDKFKWLYTLWIAGTIIEDDLKEEK